MRLVSKMPMFVLLFLFTMGTIHAIGQVTAAARGGGNQANVFGMFTANHPDYDQPYTYGGTFGADYRFGNLHLGQPAVAARISIVPGGIVGENTYLFGPEWHFRFRRFRPYADFHIGYASISYSKNRTEEALAGISSRSGRAYEFGGGVDYRLKRRFGLRIVDFQYQDWNVGTGNVFRPGEKKPPVINGSITYSPYQISGGAYFRFH
ncbi:MAG TPA: hypothetical protein VM554_04765 [Acidisarcina sp.]|nr:hypothetical protein [Acidisarcina sp.]